MVKSIPFNKALNCSCLKKVCFLSFLCYVFSLHLISPSGDVLAQTNEAEASKEPSAADYLSNEDSDKDKSAQELIDEALKLFTEQRPLDARSKLLRALQLAPSDYRPHMYLGHYYLSEVGHFRLALRYLEKAHSLFVASYGPSEQLPKDQELWKEDANLLYLLAEAWLNLDNYPKALEFLDRFGKRYWRDSFPGSRAWVLMKLKRVDEAVKVAQSGLLLDAEPGRTYNILGILVSLKGNRELALQAFARAVRVESTLGLLGQPATPLNNSGEVYREIFQEDAAEATWLKALEMPDSCSHILPSLNLAFLYIDELRFSQAEKVLDNFQSCFANNPLRTDTEHRALMALARGRIALRSGSTVEQALKLLAQAQERQQWFGKIGTNESDVRFAATLALAQAASAKAAILGEQVSGSLTEASELLFQRISFKIRAWWLNRRARQIALEELSDFEDLFVRNTDTMFEYPTLGTMCAGFPVGAFAQRIKRMLESDFRPGARPYYKLYLATNLRYHGRESEAQKLLEELLQELRPTERLARAEALAQLLLVLRAQSTSLFHSPSTTELQRIALLQQELFRLLPSHLRFIDQPLPVEVTLRGEQGLENELLWARKKLLSKRFEVAAAEIRTPFKLSLEGQLTAEGKFLLNLTLSDGSRVLSRIGGEATSKTQQAKLLNDFLDKSFSLQGDPPGNIPPLPRMFVEALRTKKQ